MLEAPSNTDLPWMVTAEEDDWITFAVKQQTLEKTKNEKGWSCYTGEMKDIDMKGIEDGDHEVPFWAMDAFFDAYTEADNEKGWQQYKFKRSTDKKGNTASFRVD